jgi:hypothetical protein
MIINTFQLTCTLHQILLGLPLGDINTEAWSSGMGLGMGLTTLPCKKENCWEASKKFSRILCRRPRPKLGCGAKERRRSNEGG